MEVLDNELYNHTRCWSHVFIRPLNFKRSFLFNGSQIPSIHDHLKVIIMGFKSIRPAGHAAALPHRSISWWNEGSLAPLSVRRRNTILIFQETWEAEGHLSHMINNPGCLTRSYASTPSPSFSSRGALVTANSPYWLMLQLVKSPIPDTHGKTQCHRWITLLREEARPARHIYASLWALWIIVQHFVSLSNCCIADADFLFCSITVGTESVDFNSMEWFLGHNLAD